MNKKIVTFGEILFRLSKENHNRLTQGHVFNGDYGGSEANVAVSLAVMNDEVEYVTRVPDNAIGHAALMHLREFGLDVSHVVYGGDRLGSYFFEPAAAMRNSMVVYDRANSCSLHSNMEISTGIPSSKMPCSSTARASLVP